MEGTWGRFLAGGHTTLGASLAFSAIFMAALLGIPGALITASESGDEQVFAGFFWVLLALVSILPTWATILWKWNHDRGFHRMHSIQEASKLEEGERARLLGRLRAHQTVVAPNGERCVGYVLTVMRGGIQAMETRCFGEAWLETPSGEVKLEAGDGSALLALDTGEDVERWHGEEAKKLAAAYGLPIANGSTVRLTLLRPGDEVSVMGHVSRAASPGGYRDHAPAVLSAGERPLSFQTKLTATEKAFLAQGLRRVRAPSAARRIGTGSDVGDNDTDVELEEPFAAEENPPMEAVSE